MDICPHRVRWDKTQKTQNLTAQLSKVTLLLVAEMIKKKSINRKNATPYNIQFPFNLRTEIPSQILPIEQSSSATPASIMAVEVINKFLSLIYSHQRFQIICLRQYRKGKLHIEVIWQGYYCQFDRPIGEVNWGIWFSRMWGRNKKAYIILQGKQIRTKQGSDDVDVFLLEDKTKAHEMGEIDSHLLPFIYDGCNNPQTASTQLNKKQKLNTNGVRCEA